MTQLIPLNPIELAPHVALGDRIAKINATADAEHQRQQDIQMNAIQLSEAQRKAKEAAGYNSAVAQGGTPAEITDRVSQVGAGAFTDWTEHVKKMNTEELAQTKSRMDLVKFHTDQMSKIADNILSLPADQRQAVWQQSVQTLKTSGDPLLSQLPDHYDENYIRQFGDVNKQLETQSKQLDLQIKKANEDRAKIEEDRKAAKEKRDIADVGQTTDTKNFDAYVKMRMNAEGVDPSTLNPRTEAAYRLKVQPDYEASKRAPSNPNKESLALAAAKGDKYAQRALDILSKSDEEGTSITPGSLDMLATQFAKTAALPPLGMGKSAASDRRQIINRASELYPHVDLATNSSDFKTNQKSLEELQSKQDQITAFESTAGKNLDIFLATAKPIYDSGSQWINKPLRSISEGGLGKADLAAFQAARRVATNEIAKVTSNPTLTGQLSDSARKEVENLIPAEATLAQIYAVANILKSDMANRKQSNDDVIQAIKSRISSPPKQSSTTGTTTRPPITNFEKKPQ